MSVLESYVQRGLSRAELAVLVAGSTNMGMQILAGRVIAPQFGSSIYTWGSIIGTFLAALSIGYYRGGKRAETDASYGKLTTLLFGAALYVGFLILASDLLLQAASQVPVPARFAPLVPVTILFGPPVYLLGTITPFAAELSTKEGTGEASGHVFAVGTVGSITGAFATTFLLVPTLSIELTWLLFGALLVFGAVQVSLEGPVGSTLAVLAVGFVVLVGATAVGPLGSSVGGETVYQTQTAYQELEVIDQGDTRTLYLDGQPHSAMDLEDPHRHVFDYTRYFHLPMLMTDDVDRVLFVGGGGFTGPKIFAERYDVTVDVVEIDPEVIRVAKEYFALEEGPRLNVYNQDGRRFLQETDEEYDLIVLDAYKKDKVPFQLTTVEFMQLTSQRLDEDGVLLANIISAPSGSGSKFYRAEYKTLSRVYPQVYSFRTSQSGFVQNIEVVATKDDDLVTEAELQRRNDERDVGYDLSSEIEFYARDVRTDDVPVLRDGRAPVDQLLDPMVGQRYVIEQNGSDNESDTARRVSEPSVGPPAGGQPPVEAQPAVGSQPGEKTQPATG